MQRLMAINRGNSPSRGSKRCKNGACTSATLVSVNRVDALTMTGRTGGDPGELIAAVEHEAPHGDQIGVEGRARLGRLLFEEHPECEHFLWRQVCSHAAHGVALAPAGLKVTQLLGDVLVMLTRQACS